MISKFMVTQIVVGAFKAALQNLETGKMEIRGRIQNIQSTALEKLAGGIQEICGDLLSLSFLSKITDGNIK